MRYTFHVSLVGLESWGFYSRSTPRVKIVLYVHYLILRSYAPKDAESGYRRTEPP